MMSAGYSATTVGAGDGRNDSDDPSGVAVQPVQGQNDLTPQTNPSSESAAAGVDFGLISSLDYGDLPASYDATLLGDDGARHMVGSLMLGQQVDADGDGQPEVGATGDDNDGSDDDDGVAKTPGVNWATGSAGGSLDIRTTENGFVTAWIDWNDDGLFQASEKILDDLPVSAGDQAVTFDIPVTADPAADHFIRVRLYDATTGGSASPTGYGGPGEVKDYRLNNLALAMAIDTFEGSDHGDYILLEWSTSSEVELVGFELYRATAPDEGAATRLTTVMIAAQGPGTSQSFAYKYGDFAVLTGTTYYYWLEGLSTTGSRERLGPVVVTVGVPTAVSLAGFEIAEHPSTTLLLLIPLSALAATLFLRRRRLI